MTARDPRLRDVRGADEDRGGRTKQRRLVRSDGPDLPLVDVMERDERIEDVVDAALATHAPEAVR